MLDLYLASRAKVTYIKLKKTNYAIGQKVIDIAIVDDHQIFVDALSYVLDSESLIHVSFTAKNGHELLKELEETMVAVILLDLDMPIMDGREALHILRKKYHNTVKIIILSVHYSEEHIRKYMKAGADGYLSKDSDVRVLLEAIHSVNEKGYYFYDKVSPQLVSELVNKNTPFPPVLVGEPLSEREIEVIKLLCLGMTSPQIAEKIKLSIRTIENHRHRISKKIGANNTADIIVYAIKYGYHKIDY